MRRPFRALPRAQQIAAILRMRGQLQEARGHGRPEPAEYDDVAETRAERRFRERLKAWWPEGVDLYHESPGDVAASMQRRGIQGEYGVFATIGRPSAFVTTAKKTIVQFRIPPSHYEYLSPDMRYGGVSGMRHYDLLRQHGPTLIGADVGYGDNIPARWIRKITVTGQRPGE